MRIRSIKPEFWRSPTIAALDPFDRLLFIGLWSYVDDHGRGRDDPAEIIGDLFSRDMFNDPAGTAAKVRGGLANLLTRGLITRYEVSGSHFLAIPSWTEHQRVDRPKDSAFPSPEQGNPLPREGDAINRVDAATEQGGGTGSREVEQGGGTARASREIEPSFPDFETVWQTWPKKTDKDRAEREYMKHVRKVDGLADTIRAFGAAYGATTEKQYIPALAAWLHRKRWTDELPQARNGQQTRTQTGLSVAEDLRRMEEGS